MNLIETRVYFARVGLFCHNFNERSTIFGNGKRLLSGSPIMFDQKTEDGWYIFHVLDGKGMYVKVPSYDLGNEVSEVPLQDCEIELDEKEKLHYFNYNGQIEE